MHIQGHSFHVHANVPWSPYHTGKEAKANQDSFGMEHTEAQVLPNWEAGVGRGVGS